MKKSSASHPPERTCVGCRQVQAKWQMVRLVSTPDGVVVDPRGKKSGRGAYLCPRLECWVKGLKGDSLNHVLRTTVPAENLRALQEYGQRLFSGGVG